MLTTIGIGVLVSVAKAIIALTGLWIFGRIADKLTGVNFNEKMESLSDSHFVEYYKFRWLGGAIVLAATLL